MTVKVLVDPTARASAKVNPPPTPSMMIGLSTVLPLLVKVFPEVAANVMALEVAEIVIPVERVKSPYTEKVSALKVPANPVKLTL